MDWLELYTMKGTLGTYSRQASGEKKLFSSYLEVKAHDVHIWKNISYLKAIFLKTCMILYSLKDVDYFMCTSVWLKRVPHAYLLLKVRRRYLISGNRKYRGLLTSMLVAGTKPRSSTRATSALKH